MSGNLAALVCGVLMVAVPLALVAWQAWATWRDGEGHK